MCVFPLSVRLEISLPSADSSLTLTTTLVSRPLLRESLRRVSRDWAGRARTLTVSQRLIVSRLLHNALSILSLVSLPLVLPSLSLPPSLSTCLAPLDAMLRSVVIAAHGQYGNQATIDEAKARYSVYIY